MSEPSPEDIAAASSTPPASKPIAKRKRNEPDLHKKASYLPDIHRLLPQSPDAEQGIISSLFLSPAEVAGICYERRLTGDSFHIPSHAMIYRTIMEMYDANEPIDIISVSQKLRDRNQLDQCGGPAFISQLFTFLPTAANAAYYSEIVQEKYTLREIIRICTEYAARSYDEQHEVQTLLDECEIKIMAIRPNQTGQIRSMKDLASEAVVALDRVYENRGVITGLSTGFASLDKKTDGLHADEMIVIAARPSHGKSALMMNMAEHIALDCGKAVAVFSLEMSASQLVQRMLCSRAKINFFKFRDGFVSERDFPAITAAASRLASAKIFIDDASDLTIQEMRARARRLKKKEDIQAIFVDYLQLLTAASQRGPENRQTEVATISGGLKKMAKELGIPVVVLAQIGRGVEHDKRKPRLSDLRESGAIEQDADAVVFLTNEERLAETEEDKKAVEGMATLDIAKNRSGPCGQVSLTFLKEYTRFEERATDQPEPEQPGLGI